MKSLATICLVLSAVIGLSLTSPLDNESVEAEIKPAQSADDVNMRLNSDVVPISYKLTFTPYFVDENVQESGSMVTKKAFTFDGIAEITVKATVDGVNAITLQANDLTILTYQFGGFSYAYKADQYNASTDKWIIPLTSSNSSLIKDVATSFTVMFNGNIREEMAGFYRSYYLKGGNKVWMATTQFQSTDARKAFPCFDEPGFKANFKVIIRTPNGMKSISNTELEINSPTIELTRASFEFKWTPRMSSYLLAFIVSDFDSAEEGKFHVYARPEAKNATGKSLEFGVKMLKKFGEYLDIDYYSVANVTKMDMAAIPDFSAGAMENWGLLTYRETGILYYPDDTPSINEQRIIAVIAHEQAHQWFGDLVTCKWWSETWLNEGFARYFQYFGTEMVQTGWDLEQQFVVENLQQSMQLDSTDDTHPMTDKTVNTKAQASSMFDNISYNKAASIIRMLKTHIGATNFANILKSYLKDNLDNGVVEPSNLFTAIEKTVTQENNTIWWAPWTVTSGFPLVTVTVKNTTLEVTQKRFMRASEENTKPEKYNIPITFTIDSENYEDTTTKFVFNITDPVVKSFILPKKPSKYIILNPKQTGFYRVNYDAENWSNIKTGLWKDNFDDIHVMNRAQIVDDLFNLARAGVIEYKTAVDIIRYIKKEKNYIPWLSAINNGLTFLSQRVALKDRDRKLFEWFVLDTMEDVYKHLTFNDKDTESRTDVYNRVNIQSWLCKYGHKGCIDESVKVFESFMKNGTKVHKNRRSIVYCNGVRNGNVMQFDFLYNKLATESIAAEQLNLLIGMACTKEPALVKKYLDRVLDTDDIRVQDRSAAINNVLNANPEGANLLYEYIIANRVKWIAKVGSLGTLTSCAGRFTSSEQFTKYEGWLKSEETALGATVHGPLNTALVNAKKNLEWDKNYMTKFIDHLGDISSATTKTISFLISVISITVLYFFN